MRWYVSAATGRGAAFIAANLPADVIIMDDGMQNPRLDKDITLAVFDGGLGLEMDGFSSGPLRQTLSSALPLFDITVINGEDKTGLRAILPQKMACLSAEFCSTLKLPSR